MTSALLTDLYQLTMYEAYLEAGIAEREVRFDLFVRRAPFGGAYVLACGLDRAVDELVDLRFTEEDLSYLRGLGRFSERFLEALGDFRFRCDVDAVAEGEVIFPREPILSVTGPLAQAQFVETRLLNRICFESLVATKASRVVRAAAGRPVVEFGLRRAQGPDGGISASRAAFVGGCAATSNVEAGRRFGIPVAGTHAHSYVLAFDDELEAFRHYVEVYPDRPTLLVDTFHTLESGLPHAIEVAKEAAARGARVGSIRLDSGDLAALAREARRRLDEAGLNDVRIFASGDLDEERVARLVEGGAPIDAFGVGTRLATAHGDPALTGVYKLAARRSDGAWKPVRKLSDDPAKATLPGLKQVHRIERDGRSVEDVIETIDGEAPGSSRPLLEPVLRGGRRVRAARPIEEARAAAAAALERLPPECLRLRDPAAYPVRLGARLQALLTED